MLLSPTFSSEASLYLPRKASYVLHHWHKLAAGKFTWVFNMEFVSEYRLQFLGALSQASSSTSHGLFIDSCYAHCQIGTQETWLAADSPVLSKTVRVV